MNLDRFIRLVLLFFLLLFQPHIGITQQLKGGFDPKEYRQLMVMTDSISQKTMKPLGFQTEGSTLRYISPAKGFDNQFTFWMRSDSVGIINIRGTTGSANSWLANFYSAMIPSRGTLQLNDSTSFKYQLAADPKAFVHVGWTVSLGFIAPDILRVLNESYQRGMREVIIVGHSQGAAMAFLLRSYLEYLPEGIPKDIRYKTYCSAAPKPGNLYYAYDFDFISRNGMGIRIVNTADWVPEMPLSIQRVSDMNPNPITNYKEAIKNMNFFLRAYISSAYRNMMGTADKGVRYFRRYLGKGVYKQVKKALPGFKEPQYAPSNYYVPAGSPVILMADDVYKAKFPFTGKNFFVYHMPPAYIYLLDQLYPINQPASR